MRLLVTIIVSLGVSFWLDTHGEISTEKFDPNIGIVEYVKLNVRPNPMTGFFESSIAEPPYHSFKIENNSTERSKQAEASHQSTDLENEPKINFKTTSVVSEGKSLLNIGGDLEVDDKALHNDPAIEKSDSALKINSRKPQKTSDDSMVKPDRLNGDSNSSIARKAPITKSPSMDNNSSISSSEINRDQDVLPFLTSDFFADSMSVTNAEEDPMGTQRLLQVKNSRFSPSLLAGSAFKHTSNPDKAENPERKNSTTLDITIGVNLGLGEYAVGDYFVCAPAASLMQMRTYNDPLQKFDKDMRVYDADVFIAGLTAPLVLPNDYTLTLSHSYVAPSTFRGGRNLISYSNTPTVTLTKNLPMEDGNMLILVAGMSYTFSNGDTLEEQIADPVYFNFLNAVMGNSAADDYPANLQDGYTFMLSASYMIPYSERISIVPSVSFQRFTFTEGMNDGRIDKTFNLGVSASYSWYEWLSLSLMANYTTKSSSDINTPEFDDFIFGGGINVNHSF